MNRSSDPVLPRIPGSAVIAVVLFGFQAVIALGTGVALLALLPPVFPLLVIGSGVLHAAIAVGIGRRKPWARLTGIILTAAAVALAAADIFLAAEEGVPSAGGAVLGFAVLQLCFLVQRNTRAWCNDLAPGETPLGPAAEEPFTYRDRVELVEGIDGVGLRQGAVGTVVDLPADPGTVVVEFDDHPDREPVQVTLHASEIRPAG